MLFGGVGCFVAGLFFTFLALILSSSLFYAIGPSSLFVGVILGVVGLLIGYGHNKSMGSASAPKAEGEGRIVARFAINDVGEMIFDNFDYDAEDGRYYVRVQFLGGRREEFECARPVFDQCGEG